MRRDRILPISCHTFVELMLFAVFTLDGYTAFATSTSSARHTTKITVPMKIVRSAKAAVPDGTTPGNCGNIEFYLQNDGNGQVDAEEYVDSFLGPITSLTYSTYVVIRTR
jgi:hypothetical protein